MGRTGGSNRTHALLAAVMYNAERMFWIKLCRQNFKWVEVLGTGVVAQQWSTIMNIMVCWRVRGTSGVPR